MAADPPLRIGMLTPSSNTVVEPVVADMLASLPEVTAHAARLRVTEISLTNQSQSQFAMETMLAAGDLLADASCSSADTATGEGVAVYLYSGADVTPVDIDGTDPEPLTTANVVPKDDQSGDFSYEVGFLLAGDYTAALTCQAALDDPEVADEELVFAQSANVVIDPADTPTVQDFVVADPPAQQ